MLTSQFNFKASGKEVKYIIGPRRPGDLGNVVADPSISEKELSWTAKRGLKEMCEDLWRWQDQNPYGFRKKEDAK